MTMRDLIIARREDGAAVEGLTWPEWTHRRAAVRRDPFYWLRVLAALPGVLYGVSSGILRMLPAGVFIAYTVAFGVHLAKDSELAARPLVDVVAGFTLTQVYSDLMVCLGIATILFAIRIATHVFPEHKIEGGHLPPIPSAWQEAERRLAAERGADPGSLQVRYPGVGERRGEE